MDEARKERLGRNEAIFRKVNEGIRAGHPATAELVAFRCECSVLGCNELIELHVDEYEAVRANPRRFAMVDGHDIDEIETVVERNDRYIVAEKHAETSGVAEGTDPRR